MSDITNIEIENIREIVPDLLFKKFKKYNITSIESVLNISVEEFRKYPSVGVIAEQQFLNFIKILHGKYGKIANIYHKNYTKHLPLNFNSELNLLELFTSIIEDFLNIIKTFPYKIKNTQKRNIRHIDVIRKYYGLKSQKYDTNSIAISHRLTQEGVRQIALRFITEITNLLNGNYLEKWKCECKPEVVEFIQSFKKDLDGHHILKENQLSSWLKDYGIELSNETKNYFPILLKAWGFEQIPVSNYHRMRNKVFYADESFDHKFFLKVSTKIISYLLKKVIPVSMNDIVTEVQREYNADDDIIKRTFGIIDEIEKTDKELYQIRFDLLSTINDYAYRILYEKRKGLAHDEILDLINNRLAHKNKQISMTILKHNLRQTDFIVPVGKTGVWVLKDLNVNVETQINLILKTCRTIDKPLTISEITKYIHENLLRKDVPYWSVEANLRNYKKYFIKLKGSRFALAEKAAIYKDDIVVETKAPFKRKVMLKIDIITNKSVELLKKAPDNQMRLVDLIRVLTRDNSSFSITHIYKSISTNPLIFKKENTSSRVKIVKLVAPITVIYNKPIGVVDVRTYNSKN